MFVMGASLLRSAAPVLEWRAARATRTYRVDGSGPLARSRALAVRFSDVPRLRPLAEPLAQRPVHLLGLRHADDLLVAAHGLGQLRIGLGEEGHLPGRHALGIYL